MIIMPYDPVDAVRCIQDNLAAFEQAHPLEAQHGLFRLAREQLATLRQTADNPPTDGFVIPLESAGLIRLNLQEVQDQIPETKTDGGFCLAMQQLDVLIDRLPGRPESNPGPYADPACSERACDACGKLYRGPAMYCSLVCAYKDSF